MPQLFYFDLKGGIPKRDHAGEECHDVYQAARKADDMARRFSRTRPSIAGRGYYVSVIDSTSREIYQAPIKLVA